MDAYCWPSSHRIPVQKILPVSMELTHNCSALVLVFENGGCCHSSPLHSLLYIIRVLHTTAREPNPTYEAISHGRKTHFANNEKLYLQNMC